MSDTGESCPAGNPNWPLEWPQTPRYMALALMVAIFFYVIVFSGLTLVLRHERPLVDHYPGLIILFNCGVLLQVLSQGLMVYLTPAKLHCAAAFVALALLIPFISAPLLVRLTHYRQQILFHREIRVMQWPQGSDGAKGSKKRLNRLGFRASQLMVLIYLAAMSFGSLALIGVTFGLDTDLLHNCYGCELAGLKVILIFTIVVVIALATIVSVCQIRKESDTFGIIKDTTRVAQVMLVCMTCWLALNRIDPGKLSEAGVMYWSYFTVLGVTVSFTIICVKPVLNTMKVVRRRRGRRGGSSSTASTILNETFQELLSDPSGIEAFLVFSAEDLSAMNFRFWVEANRWKESFYHQTRSPMQRQKAADLIYDHFVDTGSVMCVRLSRDCRDNLAQAFNRPIERFSSGTNSLMSMFRTLSRARTRGSTIDSRDSGKWRHSRSLTAGELSTRLSKKASSDATPLTDFLDGNKTGMVSSHAAAPSITSISDEEYDEFPQSNQPTLVPANVFDEAIEEVYSYMKNNTYPLFRKSEYYQAYLHNDLAGYFASRNIVARDRLETDEA